jgi:lysozyme
MRTNDAGLHIIKVCEGFRRRPYFDVGGVVTVGHGTTRGWDNRPLTMDMAPITRADAEAFLERDVVATENFVSRLVKVGLNENEYSALVSFTYNVGAGNLQRSKLRMKLNRGNRAGAADEFQWWRRAAGRIYRGLVIRRSMERGLFLDETFENGTDDSNRPVN